MTQTLPIPAAAQSQSYPPRLPTGTRRQRPGWRWPLRIIAPLLALLVWTQPLLMGLFLGGDFDKLAVHAAVGGGLTGLAGIQFLVAVPAWRPGGLPGWVAAVGAAMWVGAIVQIVAGYQRNLGLHLPLGVAIALAGTSVAVRAWLPPRQSARSNAPADPPGDLPLHPPVDAMVHRPTDPLANPPTDPPAHSPTDPPAHSPTDPPAPTAAGTS